MEYYWAEWKPIAAHDTTESHRLIFEWKNSDPRVYRVWWYLNKSQGHTKLTYNFMCVHCGALEGA